MDLSCESSKEYVVNTWTEFLLVTGMGITTASHYARLFEKHEVTLNMISELDHNLLSEIGIWKIGHRILVLKVIKLFLSERRENHFDNYVRSEESFNYSSNVIDSFFSPTEIYFDSISQSNDIMNEAPKSVPLPNLKYDSSDISVSKGNSLTFAINQNDSKDSFVSGEIEYFLNEDQVKHKIMITTLSVSSFSSQIGIVHRNISDFAIFVFNNEESKLQVLKESSEMREDTIYYVIENNKMNIFKKLEKRAMRDHATYLSDKSKKQILTSENFPLKVDFIPDNELYLNQIGRLGLCMAPGRCKKSSNKSWIRDIDIDLNRLKEVYGCNVLVSLVRHSELQTLGIPNLFEEVEKRGLESIHFPIKDKWVPDSMTELIKLVEIILQRLKQGKSVVLHCNGGKGRSGTVAVACLVAMGKRAPNSIEVVRKARSGTIRNPIQVIYVKRFKKAWMAYHRKLKLNEITTESDIIEIENMDDSSDELDSCAALLSEIEDKKSPSKKKNDRLDDSEEKPMPKTNKLGDSIEKKSPSLKRKILKEKKRPSQNKV